MQQIKYLENNQSEAAKIRVERLPEKEDEKLHLELLSKQSICALDFMELSWMLFDDEFSVISKS